MGPCCPPHFLPQVSPASLKALSADHPPQPPVLCTPPRPQQRLACDPLPPATASCCFCDTVLLLLHLPGHCLGPVTCPYPSPAPPRATSPGPQLQGLSFLPSAQCYHVTCPKVNSFSSLIPAPDRRHPHLQQPRAFPVLGGPGVSRTAGPCVRALSIRTDGASRITFTGALQEKRDNGAPIYPVTQTKIPASPAVPSLAASET